MKKYQELEGNECWWKMPQGMDRMMTAVTHICQDKTGAIELTYEDGAKERRECDKDMNEFGSVFAIVSYVQDGRERNNSVERNDEGNNL